MKIGDKVRFLNDVGGGIVVGFQGKDLAVVKDEDGFEVPTLIKECVVIDTDDYNLARPQKPQAKPVEKTPTSVSALLHDVDELDEDAEEEDIADRPITFRPKALERRGGNQWTAFLAFVPTDVKDRDDDAVFEVYLVNDSNFNMRFVLFTHEGAAVTLRHEGEVVGNTKLFLQEVRRDEIGAWERITVQAFAYKPEKTFLPKAPLNVGLRIDGSKFFRQNTFTPSEYFTSPSLRFDLVRDDKPVRTVFVEAAEVHEAMTDKPKEADRSRQRALTMSLREGKKIRENQILEVDLHVDELLDTTAGLEAKDILEYQMKVFRETMDAELKHRGRKIVFIHGKGEGVLRSAILKELKTRYRQCRYQDASFREYGYGATMVTI